MFEAVRSTSSAELFGKKVGYIPSSLPLNKIFLLGLSNKTLYLVKQLNKIYKDFDQLFCRCGNNNTFSKQL